MDVLVMLMVVDVMQNQFKKEIIMFEDYINLLFNKKIEYKDLLIPEEFKDKQQLLFDEIINYQLYNDFDVEYKKNHQIQNMKLKDNIIEYISPLGITVQLEKKFDTLRGNQEYYNSIRDEMQKIKCTNCQLQQYCPYDIPTIDQCGFTIKFQALLYRNLLVIYENKYINNKKEHIKQIEICKDFKAGVINEL